jgi:hypothetical protein
MSGQEDGRLGVADRATPEPSPQAVSSLRGGIADARVRDAANRLFKFVVEWRTSSSRDDTIYGLHIGDPREAECRASDIILLLGAAEAMGVGPDHQALGK